MCLAAPARVIARDGDDAVVDCDGVRLRVNATLTPDIAAGDLGLVHVGFILARIDEGHGAAMLETLRPSGSGATL